MHSGNKVRCFHHRYRLCSRSHSLTHCFRGYWSLRSHHTRRKVRFLYPCSGCWKCCPGYLSYTGSPGKRMLFRLIRLLSVLHRSRCLPVRTGSGSVSLRYLLRLYRIPCRLRRSSLQCLGSVCLIVFRYSLQIPCIVSIFPVVSIFISNLCLVSTSVVTVSNCNAFVFLFPLILTALYETCRIRDFDTLSAACIGNGCLVLFLIQPCTNN